MIATVLPTAFPPTVNPATKADIKSATICALEKDIHVLSSTLYNSFHDMTLARHIGAAEVADIMKKSDAIAVQLSGSGPSVFGLYDNKDVAEKAAVTLAAVGADVFIAKPINS